MNTALFLTMLIVTTAADAVFLREINAAVKRRKLTANEKTLGSLVRGMTVFLAVVGISDGIGLIEFGVYRGAFLFLGLVTGVSFLLCEVCKSRRHPLFSLAVKTMMTAAVLEVTLFNLPVYRLWGGNYPAMEFKAARFAADSGVRYREKNDDIAVFGSNGVEFTLEGINEEVANVFVDLSFDGGTRGAMMYVDAMDETQTSVYRVDVANTKVSMNRWGSQFADLQLSGKVSNLRIRIVPMNNGIVYIRSISLNSPPPMDISWLRFLLIVTLVCFIHSVINGRTLQLGYSWTKKLCRISAACITLIACAAAIGASTYKLCDQKWSDVLKQETGNQMSQELVEAFEHGSTSLLEEPAEELKAFDDPYDRRLRESQGLDIRWDHVYYNGHYYSYYGIAPVILVFMPYHLMTGYFLPDAAAIMLFAVIGIIGLSCLFMKYIEKYFPEAPAGFVIIALVILQTVSGIWFSVGRPLFYEVAIAAGFAALTWAVYFLLSSGVIGKERPSLVKTAISSLLFAVAVLSRPTLVLYCICAAAFMLAALPRAAGRKGHRKDTKLFNAAGVRYLLCAIVPMACLGLCQMWYNYDRFGSPFEFGIQYSLTINDFTRTRFHWQLSLIALYNYLFNTPVITPVYPIVSTRFQFMNVGGFFYEDFDSTMNSSGLFFLALPMFAYFLAGRALRKFPDRRTRLSKAAYIGIPCVVIPFVIIASVWESGYAVRYMADFAWQSLLGAFAVIFLLYAKNGNQQVRKLVRIFMCFSLVWTLFIAGVQDVNHLFRFTDGHWDFPEIAYDVEQFFAIWK